MSLDSFLDLWLGTAVFGTWTLPSNCWTLEAYSSTDFTSIWLMISCCGPCLFIIPPPNALFPLSSVGVISHYSLSSTVDPGHFSIFHPNKSLWNFFDLSSSSAGISKCPIVGTLLFTSRTINVLKIRANDLPRPLMLVNNSSHFKSSHATRIPTTKEMNIS